ncbi:MAG: hypothetical protein IPL65_01785 [Lewinellaceae bacterium]|nr:hypothetical protein [Lewinellaceae bacterium]
MSEMLECRVRDNGVGREQAARLREEKKPGHQSVAMEVTRERLEALRGDKNYNPLEINDVVNSDGSIGGTEVIVRLPAHFEF